MAGEYMWRTYLKEEEFLDQYGDVASAASELLGDEWTPNYACSDRDRRNRDYLLSIGELIALTFERAAVFRDGPSFSSAQILLHSSKCIVNVRVRQTEDGGLMAKRIVDRPE